MPDSDIERGPSVDALVVRARSDREAFGRLYEIYYDRILRYCLRRLYQRTAAEDVCGEVFLFVARKMRTFRGTTELDFRRWVYRIATTEVNAHLRHAKRRKELWDEALQQQLLPTSALNPEQPSESLEWSAVYRAVSQLGTREQSIVALRLFEDLPHEEIAKILKVRTGAVRAAYCRALRKLRHLLAPELDGAQDATI